MGENTEHGWWVKRIELEHVCLPPEPYPDNYNWDFGSIWHCGECDLEWIWAEGCTWLVTK